MEGIFARRATELSFRHVTTKTWAYSGVFGFSEFFSDKLCPPPKSLFENTMGNPVFERHFLELILGVYIVNAMTFHQKEVGQHV